MPLPGAVEVCSEAFPMKRSKPGREGPAQTVDIEGEALIKSGEKPGDLVAKCCDLLRGTREPVNAVHLEREH